MGSEIKSIQVRLRTSLAHDKDLLRTSLVYMLASREHEKTILQFLNGTHPRTTGDPEATRLLQMLHEDVVSARQEGIAEAQTTPAKSKREKKTDNQKQKEKSQDGKVRRAAEKLYDPMVDPLSKAQGLAAQPNTALREAVLKDPSKVREKEVRKLILKGHPIGAVVKDDTAESKWTIRPEYDRPVDEWVSWAMTRHPDAKEAKKAVAAAKNAEKGFRAVVDRNIPVDKGTLFKQLRDLPITPEYPNRPYIGKGAAPLVQTVAKLLGFSIAKKASSFDEGAYTAAFTRIASLRTLRRNQEATNQERADEAAGICKQIPPDVIEVLLRIERAVQAEHECRSGNTAKEGYQITGRSLKGISAVLKAWRALAEQTPQALKEATAQVRSASTRDFGDAVLFDRLAELDAHCTWREIQTDDEGKDTSYLFRWSQANKLRIPHRIPTHSEVDPLRHPVHTELSSAANGVHFSDFIPSGMPIEEPDRSVTEIGSGSVVVRLVGENGSYQDAVLPLTRGLGRIRGRAKRSPTKSSPMRIEGKTFTIQVPTIEGLGNKHRKFVDRPFELGGAKVIFDRDGLDDVCVDRFALVKAQKDFQQLSLSDPDLRAKLNRSVDAFYNAWGQRIPPVHLHISIEVGTDDFDAVWSKYLRKEKSATSDLIGSRLLGYDMGYANGGGITIFEVVPVVTGGILIDSCIAIKPIYQEAVLLDGDSKSCQKLSDFKALIKFGQATLGLQKKVVRSRQDNQLTGPLLQEDDVELADRVRAIAGKAPLTRFPQCRIALDVALDRLKRATWADSWEANMHSIEAVSRVMLRLTRQRYKHDPRGMGGVSKKRIEALIDFKDYETAYAQRGFLGKKGGLVPTPKRVFHLPQIRDLWTAITNLREERVKKSASRVDQLARHYKATAVVYENLSFKRSENHDKSLNRMLANFLPHRTVDVLKGLLGASAIHTREVDPEYTSRFDPDTRAPCVRLDTLYPGWMRGQSWRKAKASNPILAKAALGALVPSRNGGPTVATLDSNGTLVEMNAEEIASANIALRLFESKGDVADSRMTTVTTIFDEDSQRHIIKNPIQWRGMTFAKKETPDARSGTPREEIAVTGKRHRFHRDITGHVLSQNVWFDDGAFWPMVEARVAKALYEQKWTAVHISAA